MWALHRPLVASPATPGASCAIDPGVVLLDRSTRSVWLLDVRPLSNLKPGIWVLTQMFLIQWLLHLMMIISAIRLIQWPHMFWMEDVLLNKLLWRGAVGILFSSFCLNLVPRNIHTMFGGFILLLRESLIEGEGQTRR